MLSDLLYNLFRAAHSVRRSGENAAGIAGALAAGIEPAQSGLIGIVAHDAHGGAGARLDRGEHRVGRGKAVQLFLQQRQRLLQRRADERRQAIVQVAPAHGGAVGRCDLPRPDRRTVREEIADRLCGSGIALAAEGVGGLLQPSLKGDAREHVRAAEVLRRDGDEQMKEELVDVQDVLNSYASNLYNNMNDTSTVQGKVAKLYTILLSMPCRVAAGAAILILAVLTILLGYPRYRGLFSLGVEGLICSVIFAPGIGLMGNKVLSLLTDRILGRTIDVNLKAFLWMGCISAGAGVVFLLAGLIVSWKDDR